MNKTYILKRGDIRRGGYLYHNGKVISIFQNEPPAPP